jgi:hypothetical protein
MAGVVFVVVGVAWLPLVTIVEGELTRGVLLLATRRDELAEDGEDSEPSTLLFLYILNKYFGVTFQIEIINWTWQKLLYFSPTILN